MRVTKNGVTIDTGVKHLGAYYLVIESDGEEFTINVSDDLVATFEKFLSDPEPAEDTRKWHFEAFESVEDENNMRYYCRKCDTRSLSCAIRNDGNAQCFNCNSLVENIFSFENKIYDD